VLEQPGQCAWQIYDAKVAHLLRKEYQGRHVTRAVGNTLEELIGRMEGVNQEQLRRTIAEYNKAVKGDRQFDPTAKDGCATEGLAIPKSNWALPIDTPPFQAYAITCGVTFTFGGIKVSLASEILDTLDRPIPGLFAAGEMVGGIFYFNYPGGSGLTSGAVFGKIAGESAATYAGTRKQ
jgi:tricarballylate dehydrogenase